MTDEKPRVIIIPPKPELQQTAAVTKTASRCGVLPRLDQGRRTGQQL